MDDKVLIGPPELSLVIPTYNERSNIRPLTEAVAKALAGVHWEIIFVDDDSPDGTCAEIAAVARDGAPIRSIRRVGRRGLASAVVEGAMSARGGLRGGWVGERLLEASKGRVSGRCVGGWIGGMCLSDRMVMSRRQRVKAQYAAVTHLYAIMQTAV